MSRAVSGPYVQCVCPKHGGTTWLHFDTEKDDVCLLPVEAREAAYPLMWRARVVHPQWFGRRCRIIVHGGKRGARLIEFDDGQRVVCPGAYLRRAA